MTRVRFDPSFVEHERWERLGADALVLHITALSYVTRTLSDGVLTRKRLRVLTPLVDDPEGVAARLVTDGLWSELDDDTLRVCTARDDLRFSDDRGDDQPSRLYVETERKRATERKAKWKATRAAREAQEVERVPERVPNASRNGAQASADQPSAVQDPQGPGPALPTAGDGCADGMCDGTGWIDGPDGRAKKCSDFAWHRRDQQQPWQQKRPA
jgi:hypothetical protein